MSRYTLFHNVGAYGNAGVEGEYKMFIKSIGYAPLCTIAFSVAAEACPQMENVYLDMKPYIDIHKKYSIPGINVCIKLF